MGYATSLKGKVVLVTGATSGIGEVTARVLAAMGAETVLVGRSPQKTARVADAIRAATGSQGVSYLTADCSSQAQVHALAAAFRGRFDRLDVLVNNVGAWFKTRQLSVDGIEMTFALNHLSSFLLTHLLLDLLQAAKSARVVNVSSEAHRGARLNFLDLQNARGYSGQKAYAQSKLANLYFTYGLAATLNADRESLNPLPEAGERLPEEVPDLGITVNALHPGLVDTPFHRSGGMPGWMQGLLRLGAITPEEGALTSIYLASSPEVAGISGQYFFKNRVVSSSHRSYSMDTARKLWDCSLELTGLPNRR
jgi:NAD(P)-dependent dehydrogenase (short-subunit alcohol dehydrogenase family)